MRIEGLKVLVTGGAGFIGSHLVDRLARGDNQVTVYDDFSSGSEQNLAHHPKSSVTVVRGDVRDLTSLERACAGKDIVFHLATHCVRLSINHPTENHEVNATGTLQALLAARKASVRRFVYCSSSEVFGDLSAEDLEGPGAIRLMEDAPKRPTTLYGASKLAGEHYSLAFRKTYGMDVAVVRPFNTYGPREHLFGPYGEVIPRFVVLMKAGFEAVIFGDGSQTRDFTYVEDTAEGILKVGECDTLNGRAVHVARGTEVSILELAKAIAEVLKIQPRVRFSAARPGEISRLGAENARAAELLGFRPGTALRDGLAKYVAWLDTTGLDYAAAAKKLMDRNWNQAPGET